MNALQEFQRNANTTACDPSLASYLAIFNRYLTERGYSARSIRAEQFYVSHFVYWMQCHHIGIKAIDEALIARFLQHHLPRCDCAGAIRNLSSSNARAALRHLLTALRVTIGVSCYAINPCAWLFHVATVCREETSVESCLACPL